DETSKLAPPTLLVLGLSLKHVGALRPAEDLLRKAQARYPGDFWVNFHVSLFLQEKRPEQVDERIRFHMAALALRPKNFHIHGLLSELLYKKGDLEGAITHLQEAVRLQPGVWYAHHDLGIVLCARNEMAKALTALNRALRLRPDLPSIHYSRALAL